MIFNEDEIPKLGLLYEEDVESKFKLFEKNKKITKDIDNKIKKYDEDFGLESAVQSLIVFTFPLITTLGVSKGFDLLMSNVNSYTLFSMFGLGCLFIYLFYKTCKSISDINNFKGSINFFKKSSKFNKLVRENKLRIKLEEEEPEILNIISNDITTIHYIEDDDLKFELLKKTTLYTDLNEAINKSSELLNEIDTLFEEKILHENSDEILKKTLEKITRLKLANYEKGYAKAYALILLVELTDKIVNFNIFIQNILEFKEENYNGELEYIRKNIEDVLSDGGYAGVENLNSNLEETLTKVSKIGKLEQKTLNLSEENLTLKKLIKSKEFLKLEPLH